MKPCNTTVYQSPLSSIFQHTPAGRAKRASHDDARASICNSSRTIRQKSLWLVGGSNEMDYDCNTKDYITGCPTLDKFTPDLEPEIDNA